MKPFAGNCLALFSFLSMTVGGQTTPARSNAPTVKNSITIRQVGKATVEIEVSSTRFFPVTNAVVVLHIGKQQSSNSRYPGDGDLHTLIFTMSASAFNDAKEGDPITVDYDPASQGEWDFGSLDKSKVAK